MRTHREPGIRRDTNGRIQAYVRANGQLRFKRFPAGTSLDAVRRWRMDTRVSLGLTKRAGGTLAADIEPFLRQIADRPRLVAERQQQLEWWAARLGHLRRHTITATDVRAALADLRRTHAASTCNHYRQALFSLYKTLDGRNAPNPVREVSPFPNPAPEARGLSYDAIRLILESMSDQGGATVKGRPRLNGIRGEGPLPRSGVHGDAAERVDALPAGAPGPGDAVARRADREGRTDADDTA